MLNTIAISKGIIGAKCETKSLQYPKIFPFCYGNNGRIYSISRLDLHFWFRMVS